MTAKKQDYTEIRDREIRSKVCELLSAMLDNPDMHGIFPTSEFMWKMETYILERIATGKCKDCRFWQTVKELVCDDKQKACMCPKILGNVDGMNREGMDDKEVLADATSCCRGGNLTTKPDFGCVCFDSKPKDGCKHEYWHLSGNELAGKGTCDDCQQEVPLYVLFENMRKRLQSQIDIVARLLIVTT